MKTTLKQIKNYNAIDITKMSFDECKEFKKNKNLTKVCTSSGLYGINGAILIDEKTGKLYKITARNSTLFYFI